MHFLILSKRIAIAALVLVAALAPLSSSQAKTYSVGVEDITYFPLYGFEDGRYGGFARAVLEAFAETYGHSFEYKARPVSRLLKGFIEGRVDLKFPANPNWAQDLKAGRTVVYSQPVVEYVDGVMVLPERLGQGLASFSVLGTVRGFSPFVWLDRIKAGSVHLDENSNFKALIKQTLARRVDGAYANVAVVNHILKGELRQPGALVFDPDLPHDRSSYHLATIKHPDLVDQFDAWMRDHGKVLDALKKRYNVTVKE